jgi:hypothetical protein
MFLPEGLDARYHHKAHMVHSPPLLKHHKEVKGKKEGKKGKA